MGLIRPIVSLDQELEQINKVKFRYTVCEMNNIFRKFLDAVKDLNGYSDHFLFTIRLFIRVSPIIL